MVDRKLITFQAPGQRILASSEVARTSLEDLQVYGKEIFQKMATEARKEPDKKQRELQKNRRASRLRVVSSYSPYY